MYTASHRFQSQIFDYLKQVTDLGQLHLLFNNVIKESQPDSMMEVIGLSTESKCAEEDLGCFESTKTLTSPTTEDILYKLAL